MLKLGKSINTLSQKRADPEKVWQAHMETQGKIEMEIMEILLEEWEGHWPKRNGKDVLIFQALLSHGGEKILVAKGKQKLLASCELFVKAKRDQGAQRQRYEEAKLHSKRTPASKGDREISKSIS